MAKKIQPEVFLESGERRNPHALLWASGKPLSAHTAWQGHKPGHQVGGTAASALGWGHSSLTQCGYGAPHCI